MSRPDAFHDSQARYPPPRCLPGTRVALLKEVFDWIERSNENILWIYGPAGAGKSAIAQTVAEACARKSTLAASFFFFHGAPGRNAAEGLIPSLAYQLIIRLPEKRAQLGSIVEADPSILYKPLELQIQKLILPLFMSTNEIHAHIPPPQPYIIIIDGLDECKGDNGQRDIVRCVGKLANTNSIPLYFLVVSRPEPQIAESFGRLVGTFHSISLASYPRVSQTRDDIRTYLRHGFNRIYEKHQFITERYWPTENIISTLVHRAGGAFIYASTVLKYVGDDDFHPKERLGEVLNTPPGRTPFAELDHLYHCILCACPYTERFLQVLTVTLICTRQIGSYSYRPCLRDIELLLQLQPGMVAIILRRMRSVLYISTSTHISFYHKSFTDFLFDKERAGNFVVEIKRGNAFIARKLLAFLEGATRADYSEFDSGTSLFSLRSAVGEISPLGIYNYAARNWYKHCAASGRCSEHPGLLEAISRVLGFPLFRLVQEGDLREVTLFFLKFFNVGDWLSVNDSLFTRTSQNSSTFRLGDRQAPEIQYQLFKNLKRHVRSEVPVSPFATFYSMGHKYFFFAGSILTYKTTRTGA